MHRGVDEVPEARQEMTASEQQHPMTAQGEAGDLPDLDTATERALELRWQQVLQDRGLDGKHLHWHDKVRDRSGRIRLRPGVDRTLAQIGVAKSVVVAELNFKDVVNRYFEIWDRSSEKHEAFKQWLPSVTRRVLRDMAVVWKNRDAAVDEWYEKVCAPTIKHALNKLEAAWSRRALDRELLKLERAKVRSVFTKQVPVSLSPSVSNIRGEGTLMVPPTTTAEQIHPQSGKNPAIEIPGRPAVKEASRDTANLATLVDNFLQRCNDVAPAGDKVMKKHIWMSVGHSTARQFQYWQEGSDKATDEDDRNFRRVLSMPPVDFILILRKKNILPPRP